MTPDDPMPLTHYPDCRPANAVTKGTETGNTKSNRSGRLRVFLDRTLSVFDGFSSYQSSASLVIICGGLGMVAAMALGWHLWAGFLVGFVPAFLTGAVVHTARA